MSNKIYDLIVIGAGPIGLACGIEAQKKDLDYLIFDKGCLVNSLYRYPMNMTFFSTSDKLEIGEFHLFPIIRNLLDLKPWSITEG